MSATYTSTGPNGGVLTVTSGALPVAVAAIDISSVHYVTSNFNVTAGTGGTVAITDPTVPKWRRRRKLPVARHRCAEYRVRRVHDARFSAKTPAPNLGVTEGPYAPAVALPGNYMAGSFATTAGGQGGTLVTQASQIEQPLLTHPRA